MIDLIPSIKDWLPNIESLSIMFVNRTPPKSYLEDKSDGKVSVVILPGIFNTWGFYKVISDAVSKAGYKVFIVKELGHNMKDIQTSAGIVKDFIKTNNLSNVVFLGHSKGGIIGKYYLTYLNDDEKALNLICISVPFSGTSIVRPLLFKTFTDFSPESKMIKELQNHKEANGRIIVLMPKGDVVIRHTNGSSLDGAREIKVDSWGHNRAVNSKDTIRVVIELLSEISKKI